MSDSTDGKSTHGPKLTIDNGQAHEAKGAFAQAKRSAQAAKSAKEERGREPLFNSDEELGNVVGFLKGVGATAWRFAVKHPHTAVGAFIGFVFAVLVLTVGLWSTIVIAVFVLVGALIGQIRDGDNSIVNFFSRLFGGGR